MAMAPLRSIAVTVPTYMYLPYKMERATAVDGKT